VTVSLGRFYFRAAGSTRYFLDHKVIFDANASYHTLSRGTGDEVRRESLLGLFGLSLRNLKVVIHPDLSDFQHMVDVFNVSFHLRPITVFRSRDLALGQRRGQCSHHSAGCRCHNMIQGGCVLLLGLDLVESFDPAVNAIVDRFVKPLDHGSPRRPLFPHDSDA
jgi:hypothetical protein